MNTILNFECLMLNVLKLANWQASKLAGFQASKLTGCKAGKLESRTAKDTNQLTFRTLLLSKMRFSVAILNMSDNE